ncbi:hypothetical protein IC582_030721 [Cucumis melo]
MNLISTLFTERRTFLCSLSDNHLFTNLVWANSFHFPSHGKPFSLRLLPPPSRGILVIGSIGTGRSYLVKYLRQTLSSFRYSISEQLLDKKPKGFLLMIVTNDDSDDIDDSGDIDDSDDIDRDLIDGAGASNYDDALTRI